MIHFDGSCEWSDEHIAVVTWATGSDGVRIKCLVRGEALDDRFGSDGNASERLRVFQENRSTIEDALRRRLNSGHFEREPSGVVPWQVVLTAADLSRSKP